MAVSTLRRLVQIVLTVVLLVANWWLEHTPAWTAERVIHDKEMSLYKNPKSEDTISLIMLFVISCLVPAAVIIIVEFFRKDNIDVVQVVLDLISTLALNGFITNVIKVFVARPRPDYFFGNPDEIIQGRKSFPSGHSSFAFSGLGFLSLYLMGKLQTQERIQGWKLCAALAPVALLAPVVAFTRHLDHRHHWGDIVAGSVLGLSLSYVCYTWTVVSWKHEKKKGETLS